MHRGIAARSGLWMVREVNYLIKADVCAIEGLWRNSLTFITPSVKKLVRLGLKTAAVLRVL